MFIFVKFERRVYMEEFRINVPKLGKTTNGEEMVELMMN